MARPITNNGTHIAICDVQILVRPNPDAIVELAKLDRALCLMSRDDPQILLLGTEGYTSAEIGARIGLSAATSRQRLSRARARLTATAWN
jgi:DNA-directed RNA polymerase specialized sigma24 family protein